MRKPGLLLAAALCVMPAAATPDGDLLELSLRSQVYRLSAGRLTPLVSAQVSGVERPYGPKISPDQRWIAFSENNDVWIYDVAGGRRYQATHFGRPATAKLLAIEVLTLGWSADSRRVLIRMMPGLEECDECPVQHQPARAAYGFYTYAPAGNALARVRLPEKFEFRAWLPDGRFIGIINRDTACQNGSIADCGTLVIMRDGSPAPQVLEGFNGLHAQLSVSPDGKSAVTSDPDQGDDRENQSQIVRIDLAAGKHQWFTPVGPRGEYQDPQFSPDGSHIAWLWFRRPLGSGRFVVLDGNRIFSCSREGFDLHWLDAGRIAVECGPELTVIDRAGKPLLRAPIPKFSAAGR